MFKVLLSSIVFLLFTFDSNVGAAEGSCPALKLSPLIPAVYTTFKTNGDLNLDELPKYAKYLKDSKILDILVAAYGGEASTMNLCDRTALIQAWVDAASRQGIGVVVQITSGLPFTETLILAELCVKLKVKAILIFPETIYIPQTVDEVIADLQLIANVAVGIPIIYGDYRAFDSATVVSTVDIFKSAAAQIPCFAGVTTDINTALNIKAATSIGDKVIIINGHETISSTIQLKFTAVVSSFINHFPDLAVGIVAAVQASDLELVERLQADLNLRYIALLGNDDIEKTEQSRFYIVNLKVAFELKTGLKTAISRPPFQLPNKELVKQIANALRGLGIKLIGTVASVLRAVV